jgi:hypothetical protein
MIAAAGLAACSVAGPSPTPSSSPPGTGPETLCAQALGSSVLSATAATVHQVRSTTTHGGAQPFTAAFPGRGDSDPAAFCWTGGDGNYQAFGVDAGGSKVLLSTIQGPASTWVPSGAPVYP